MADTSNVLNEAKALVQKRLQELDQERARLERALADLTGGRSGRRRPGRPRGIGASEIAKRLKIKPNYLYRVMGDLQKEGRVSKKGRGYHPAGK
jgi:CRP-like cAMP-binding protein